LQIRRAPIIIAILLLIFIPLYAVTHVQTTLTAEEAKMKVIDSEGTMPKAPRAQGVFKGEGWISERTVDKVILAETPFARCEAHSVMSEDGKSVVHDWLWMEEREHINVAVLDADDKFVLMKQKKYGISGESLATVGGFIEDGESPFEAALREVAEELGMGSRATKSRLEKDPKDKLTGGFRDGRISEEEMEDWVFLGKYRTSTNRGGGFVYDYFLKNAVPVAPNGGTSKFKGSGEGEKQNLLKLTIPETVAAVKNGEVQEVKWTNALSLSLLQLFTKDLDNK